MKNKNLSIAFIDDDPAERYIAEQISENVHSYSSFAESLKDHHDFYLLDVFGDLRETIYKKAKFLKKNNIPFALISGVDESFFAENLSYLGSMKSYQKPLTQEIIKNIKTNF